MLISRASFIIPICYIFASTAAADSTNYGYIAGKDTYVRIDPEHGTGEIIKFKQGIPVQRYDIEEIFTATNPAGQPNIPLNMIIKVPGEGKEFYTGFNSKDFSTWEPYLLSDQGPFGGTSWPFGSLRTEYSGKPTNVHKLDEFSLSNTNLDDFRNLVRVFPDIGNRIMNPRFVLQEHLLPFLAAYSGSLINQYSITDFNQSLSLPYVSVGVDSQQLLRADSSAFAALSEIAGAAGDSQNLSFVTGESLSTQEVRSISILDHFSNLFLPDSEIRERFSSAFNPIAPKKSAGLIPISEPRIARENSLVRIICRSMDSPGNIGSLRSFHLW